MSGLALIRVWFGGMAKEEETAVLIYLGCCAVLAFATAILLALQGASPVAAAHAAFAVGAMPLVFAAMGHFVPVLTRSSGATGAVRRLPLAMQAAGLLALGALGGWLPGWALHGALTIGLVTTGVFLAWVLGKGRKALGRPHPGLAWYVVALSCLMLALLVIGLGLLWPPAYRLARLAHLHLNTLGFIGLSAIGTLHVLMPTALGRPDPLVAQRLQQQLPWMLAGVGAAALAGGLPWLGLPAAVLLGGVVAATLVAWVRTHGLGRLLGDGVATSLLVATTGLLGLILAGLAHGFGAMPGRPAVAGFFALFLLPLVTGALSQLLPVWRFPGPLTPARTQLRERLARHARLRAGLFLAGGVVLMAGSGFGVGLLAAGVLLFAAALGGGLMRRP
jgi:hypothetical protein